MKYFLAVLKQDENTIRISKELSESLKIPLVDSIHNSKYCLKFKDGLLGIVSEEHKFFSFSYFDPKIERRFRSLSSKDLFVKALGKNKGLCFLDGTFGWGMDATVAHKLGMSVRGFEKNSILFEIIQKNLKMEKFDRKENFYLSHLDTIKDWKCIEAKVQEPFILYLDPMFVESAKSKASLSNKKLEFLKQLFNHQVLENHKSENKNSKPTIDEPMSWEDWVLFGMKVRRSNSYCKRLILKRSAKSRQPVKEMHSYMGKTVEYLVL